MADYSVDIEALKEGVGVVRVKLLDQLKDYKKTIAKPAKVLCLEAMMFNLLFAMKDAKQADASRSVLLDQVNWVNKNSLEITSHDIQSALWEECVKTALPSATAGDIS